MRVEKRATVGVAVVGVLGVIVVLAGTAFDLVPKEVAIFGGLACWFIASMIRRRANKREEGKSKQRRDDRDTAGDSR